MRPIASSFIPSLTSSVTVLSSCLSWSEEIVVDEVAPVGGFNSPSLRVRSVPFPRVGAGGCCVSTVGGCVARATSLSLTLRLYKKRRSGERENKKGEKGKSCSFSLPGAVVQPNPGLKTRHPHPHPPFPRLVLFVRRLTPAAPYVSVFFNPGIKLTYYS